MRPSRVTLLALLAAGGLLAVGALAGAPVLGALGWAALAGIGAAWMFRGTGLRLVALAVAAVGVGGAVGSVLSGGLGLVGLLPAGALFLAAVVTLRSSRTWPDGTGRRRPAAAPTDWERMNAGEDPTRDVE